MEKIKVLLAELDNKVTPNLKRRLDGYQNVLNKLDLATKEHEAEPTEESEANLVEIENYILDLEEELVEDLEDLLEDKKANAQKVLEAKPIDKEDKDKEDSGSGVLLTIVGVALAGLLGFNYFKNK